MKKTMQAK